MSQEIMEMYLVSKSPVWYTGIINQIKTKIKNNNLCDDLCNLLTIINQLIQLNVESEYKLNLNYIWVEICYLYWYETAIMRNDMRQIYSIIISYWRQVKYSTCSPPTPESWMRYFRSSSFWGLWGIWLCRTFTCEKRTYYTLEERKTEKNTICLRKIIMKFHDIIGFQVGVRKQNDYRWMEIPISISCGIICHGMKIVTESYILCHKGNMKTSQGMPLTLHL